MKSNPKLVETVQKAWNTGTKVDTSKMSPQDREVVQATIKRLEDSKPKKN